MYLFACFSLCVWYVCVCVCFSNNYNFKKLKRSRLGKGYSADQSTVQWRLWEAAISQTMKTYKPVTGGTEGLEGIDMVAEVQRGLGSQQRRRKQWLLFIYLFIFESTMWACWKDSGKLARFDERTLTYRSRCQLCSRWHWLCHLSSPDLQCRSSAVKSWSTKRSLCSHVPGALNDACSGGHVVHLWGECYRRHSAR